MLSLIHILCIRDSYWSAAELDEVDKITVYITAPACKGNEGWSFDLDLLELFYTEIPEYSEGETRKIALADTPEKTSSENKMCIRDSNKLLPLFICYRLRNNRNKGENR